MHLLSEYIKEVMAASMTIDGPYTGLLSNDESIDKPSVLVPDEIKDKIFNYFDKMGLSAPGRTKKSKRST